MRAARRWHAYVLSAGVTLGCSDGSHGGTADGQRANDASPTDALPPWPDKVDARPPTDASPTRDGAPAADANISADATVFFAPSVESAEALNRAAARFDACLTQQVGAEVWTTAYDSILLLNFANYDDRAGGAGWVKRLHECDRAALSCAEIIACMHVVDASECNLSSSSSGARCLPNNIRVQCLHGVGMGFLEDCASIGETCPEGSQANYGCFGGACDSTPSAPQSVCLNDGTVLNCLQSNWDRVACGLFAGSCWNGVQNDQCIRFGGFHCETFHQSGRPDESYCRATSAGCQTPTPWHCTEAGDLAKCETDGHSYLFHCDDLLRGSRCVEGAFEGEAACKFQPEDCQRGTRRCNGAVLEFCFEGRTGRVDCGAFGAVCSDVVVAGDHYTDCRFP